MQDPQTTQTKSSGKTFVMKKFSFSPIWGFAIICQPRMSELKFHERRQQVWNLGQRIFSELKHKLSTCTISRQLRAMQTKFVDLCSLLWPIFD